MQANLPITVSSVVRKPGTALVCALLLAACNAKVIEPMRLVAGPSLAPVGLASDLAEPRATYYGVPEASSVSFITHSQDQVVDLTY